MAADDGDAPDRDAPASPEPESPGDNADAARPTPGGRHAAPDPEEEPAAEPAPDPEPEPEPESTGSSRRGVLLGAVAIVLAAGGGVGTGFLGRRRRAAVRPLPPASLVAAAAAERGLLADLDATTGGSAEVRQVIAQARADHAAHLQALTALLGSYRPSAPAAGASPALRGVARTAAQLRTAETDAAVAAARRAAATTGSLATLFASISACESTHAALLT